MMSSYELFERYLNGSLTEKERLDFLYRLSEDPIFAQNFKIFSEMNHFVKMMSQRNLLRKTLNRVSEEYFNRTKKLALVDLIKVENCNMN